jgi:hypothetical protein
VWYSEAVVDEIIQYLGPRFIAVPETPVVLEECCAGFRQRHGIDNIVLAVDGTHIPVRRPSLDSMEYRNRKKFDSIVLQLAVDARKRIRDVYVGWPGSAHDARVFKNSPLYQK